MLPGVEGEGRGGAEGEGERQVGTVGQGQHTGLGHHGHVFLPAVGEGQRRVGELEQRGDELGLRGEEGRRGGSGGRGEGRDDYTMTRMGLAAVDGGSRPSLTV